ncbi:transmembrane protein, putative (macronuclear) [Tetrahymena thermophila SB210]|uniref:Transmembrane protein, putative n=1 Tax=Tetrahymena thermophila (strain SB210) TaxID=312017 RepID=I7M364_TETTS|nr:transmembrane protein, putative [Tetrahymena thermophila SB210]EAS02421.3 transmembrane protein, putative [Tetrahymena thermophila SB210]|eukprot:XP_001022666.3 transmembrane protein, putative [Tetrahymena thermophila SB210]
MHHHNTIQNISQSFLEKIDIFGIGIAIRFNHQPTHNTKFGGFVSLMILAIIFFQVTNVLIGLFMQKNPQVIQSDDYVFQPEPFQITPKSFNIAMGLQDVNFNQFMDETVYKIKATQQNLVRFLNQTTNKMDQKWTYKDLKMSPCTKQNFQIDGIQNYFLDLNFPIMYCFDTNEEEAIIEGEFSANVYRGIVIEFEECIGEGCASKEKKSEFLNNPTLGIFFSNSIIQVQNKDKPFLPVGKNLYWLNGPDFQKYLTLNLMNTYVNTDSSYYGSSFKKERIVNFSSSDEQVIPKTDKVMFRLTIVYEKNREVNFYRKYIKIDEAFSQLGGMFNALLSIGYIICSPISQLELNRKLLNSIFNITDGKNQEDKNKKNTKKRLPSQTKKVREILSPTSSNNTFSMNTPRKQNLHDMISTVQKNNLPQNKSHSIKDAARDFFKTQFSELQVKFKDYIFYYFRYFKSFQTTKQKIITYGTNKLYNHLDIFYIVNKLIEVEKLKYLLLNENQIKLFQYLPRPELKIEEIDLDENIDLSQKNALMEEQNQQTTNFFNQLQQSSPTSQQSTRIKQKTNKKQNQNTKFSFFGQEEKSQQEKAYEAQKAFNSIYEGQNKSNLDEKIIKMLDIKLVNLFKENSFDLASNRQQFQLNQFEYRQEENDLLSLNRTLKKCQTQFSNQTDRFDLDDIIKLQKSNSNTLNNSFRIQNPSSKTQDQKENEESDKMDYIKESNLDQIEDLKSIQQTDQQYFPSHIEKQHRIQAKNLDEDDT